MIWILIDYDIISDEFWFDSSARSNEEVIKAIQEYLDKQEKHDDWRDSKTTSKYLIKFDIVVDMSSDFFQVDHDCKRPDRMEGLLEHFIMKLGKGEVYFAGSHDFGWNRVY